MKIQSALILAAALAIAGALPGLALAVDRAPVTVGDFAARVAVLTGQPPTVLAAAAKTDPANRALLGSSLTFGAISMVAADLGVTLKSPINPTAQVTAGQAEIIAGALARGYAARGSGNTIDEPPTECLSSENRGFCVECCKTATGGNGQFCGRFCHANVAPPISPGEPLP
jgi:hypothetical protein